jgi:membrane protein DedA with SNARE-associated domain
LSSVPPELMYVIVAIVISLESMGVPLPGEIALVAASLLAVSGFANIWWVALAATLGAIVGDSIGYAIGRRGGRPFLERLGRRFPRHLGPPHLAKAEQIFQRWGVAAIFFGRFIALLRVLAGPLSGALRVPYPKFLAANAAGGVAWASGTALLVYYVGKAAETWLSRFSWIALAIAVVAGVVTTLYLRHRARREFAAIGVDGDGRAGDSRSTDGEPPETDRATVPPGAGASQSRTGPPGPAA